MRKVQKGRSGNRPAGSSGDPSGATGSAGAPEGPDTSSLTDEENLDIVRAIHEVDACEICHGEKGGVPGNENIVTVDGVKKIACDYCSVAIDRPMKYED